MHKMYGFFELKPAVSAADYATAFDAFCSHLQDQGFVTGWRFFTHEPHPGYDKTPIQAPFALEMDFPDQKQAEACYEYVAKNTEPLKTLHKAMNSKTKNGRFALFAEFVAAP